MVVGAIPNSIPGISSIEVLVIDDGSSDRTSDVAKALGVNHILRNSTTRGLARTFRTGIDYALRCGADVIVNIDGDNQYSASQIPQLIAPILSGQADMVIGDRQTVSISHFSPLKKRLQRWGSWIVSMLAGIRVNDAVSGFRAFSREAGFKLTILNNYTYTIEAILQARAKGLVIREVAISTNVKTRESRLIRSLPSYLAFSVATILRVSTMYNPLRVFLGTGLVSIALGGSILMRFLYFYFSEGGAGHVQSLIFGSIFTILGASLILGGLLADLIQFNRRLLEDLLERVKKIEQHDKRPAHTRS